MLTRNYSIFTSNKVFGYGTYFEGGTCPSSSSTYLGFGYAKNTEGNYMKDVTGTYFMTSYSANVSQQNNENATLATDYNESLNDDLGKAYGWFILPGSGSTPATKDDYKLDTAIYTLTAERQTIHGMTSDNINSESGSILTVEKSFVNNTSDDIVVNEIGLYLLLDSNVYSLPAYSNTTMLMAREVFDSSITIAPNETYTFKMMIR